MTLPALLTFHGDWEEYLDKVYDQYMADLISAPKYLRGKQIRARFNPPTQGKGFSFWHVISEGQSEESRTPDLRRCERIAWIAWMIERAEEADPRIRTWPSSRTTSRGTRERLVVWCEDAEYVVVLEENQQAFLLVSAYPVNQRRAAKLKFEWEAAQK